MLVNNVNIQKRGQILTRVGLEFSFATNVLGHYLLTRQLLDRNMLKDNAAVIEVALGGMYNHAMVGKGLYITGDGYLGARALGLAKRAQVMWPSTDATNFPLRAASTTPCTRAGPAHCQLGIVDAAFCRP